MGCEQFLHEPLRGSFTLLAARCSLHFDKPQRNEIHSLNNSSSDTIKCFLAYADTKGSDLLVHPRSVGLRLMTIPCADIVDVHCSRDKILIRKREV